VLYRQLLQRDFEKMPRVLREFHSGPTGGRAVGTVAVRRFNRWLAGLVGFPPSGDGIPIELQVIAGDGREIWIRNFGGVKRRTVQMCEDGFLLESAGTLRIGFNLLADESGMRFKQRYARIWMVPLPLRIEGQVWGHDSSWEFEVTVAGVGSYRGTMVTTR
jgi:hypothetical protein